MKKSKIIIPALGVLVLSTAASITGTVAWFTANRTASITTGNFAVVKTDGALDVACAYGVGTAIANDGNSKPTIVNPVTNAKIGDISFNPSSKQLWNDTGTGTAFRTIGSTSDYSTQPETNGSGAHTWKINDTTYHAFTWKVTLSYKWGADHTALNVFFDYTNSSMSGSAQAGEANKHTEKAFRIAVINPTSGKTVVWSKLSDANRAAADLNGDSDLTDPFEVAHVFSAVSGASAVSTYGSTGATGTGFSYFGTDKYGFGNVAPGSGTAIGSYAKAVDGDADQNNREDFLGQITYSAATDSLNLWCVAWYEGTDPTTHNDLGLAQVQSTVAFYAALNA